MIEYNGMTITAVTLRKGPCCVWWAFENDGHGGPPWIWIAHIEELIGYWQRLQDKTDSPRLWTPPPPP